MRDIVIKAATIRKELIVFSVSLVAALLLNVYSIVTYKTAWIELYSQLHVVIAVGIVIYLLVLIFRWIAIGVLRLFKSRR